MKTQMSLLLVFATTGWAVAQQALIGKQDVSSSSHDRVYSANPNSRIDPNPSG